MTRFNQDIRHKLENLNVLEKIIAINVVIFFVTAIFPSTLPWFDLPSNLSTFLKQPWSVVSYAFFHYDFWHLFFNMLWCYVIAQWFLGSLGLRIALNIYFLGVIAGGICFLLGYNLWPALGSSRLLGASAGVRALLIFLCVYNPQRSFRFFDITIRLWHIGAVLVAIDIVGVFGSNAGGSLAHLGGSVLGFFYAKQFLKDPFISKEFNRIIATCLRIFKSSKKTVLKTVHKKTAHTAGYKKDDFQSFNTQKRIDIILDKISKSGYESLTSEEKEFLFRAGRR